MKPWRPTTVALVPKTRRDHGSVKSNRYWTERAYTSGDPGSCNTFTASSAKVS